MKDGENWYAYCYNRPTTLADYFGLEGNPTDKILKMSNQYSYYSIRDIFGSNGQVGGIVMAAGKSSYVCSVQYGSKMLLVEYDISKYYGQKGTYQTQATVSMSEGMYTLNSKTAALGQVNIRYNASAGRTAINLSELQKYFAKVWCPTVESIANKGAAAKGFRFVGFGVQLELDSSIATVGCELVFYTNDIQQDAAYQIYVYGGGALGQDLKRAIAELTKNPGILLGNGTTSRFEGSAAVFAIWGNEHFRHAKDYRGSFNSASVTVNHAKGYVSWSDKCLVAGAGISTSLFCASVGRTYYDLIGDGEFLDIDPLKAQTKNIAQTISMPEL